MGMTMKLLHILAVAFLCWAHHHRGCNAAILMSSTDPSKVFPPGVQLLELEYSIRGRLRRTRYYDKQQSAIFEAISHALHTFSKDEGENHIYLTGGSGTSGGCWPLAFLSAGFESLTEVTVHATTQEELDEIIAKKSEVRERLQDKIMNLFEKDLKSKYKNLSLLSAPRKPEGITFDLKLTEPYKEPPSPFNKKGYYDDPLEYAASLVDQAIYQAINESTGKLNSACRGSTGTPAPNNTRQIHHRYCSRNANEKERLEMLTKDAIHTIAKEHDWFTINARPDLDE